MIFLWNVQSLGKRINIMRIPCVIERKIMNDGCCLYFLCRRQIATKESKSFDDKGGGWISWIPRNNYPDSFFLSLIFFTLSDSNGFRCMQATLPLVFLLPICEMTDFPYVSRVCMSDTFAKSHRNDMHQLGFENKTFLAFLSASYICIVLPAPLATKVSYYSLTVLYAAPGTMAARRRSPIKRSFCKRTIPLQTYEQLTLHTRYCLHICH